MMILFYILQKPPVLLRRRSASTNNNCDVRRNMPTTSYLAIHFYPSHTDGALYRAPICMCASAMLAAMPASVESSAPVSV